VQRDFTAPWPNERWVAVVRPSLDAVHRLRWSNWRRPPPSPISDQPLPARSRSSMKITIYGWSIRVHVDVPFWCGVVWGARPAGGSEPMAEAGLPFRCVG
jgi:hypothetical protein